ncbi:MAG: TRAP transporter TatT component family protein [Xanthomonadaceae bacterium]|nr:TRAP transporter TatT component family protein [Xanthomonadaceae bacterium]
MHATVPALHTVTRTVPRRASAWHALRIVVAAGLAIALVGCAAVARRAADNLASNLGQAVVNSNDPATVRDGLPAYLLLLDGLINGSPDSPGLLLAAAELNAAYAGNFTQEPARASRLSDKALGYARRASCLRSQPLCDSLDGPIPDFEAALADFTAKDIGLIYGLAATWTGYLQANREDWQAIANLPKVEMLLKRVVAENPRHADGLAFVYLGALNSLRPAAVGGDPEAGRAYFERAIELSSQRNLYAKTMMAEYYARLVFDRELHDSLIREVLEADPIAPGFTLANVLAQERARYLQASADDFF